MLTVLLKRSIGFGESYFHVGYGGGNKWILLSKASVQYLKHTHVYVHCAQYLGKGMTIRKRKHPKNKAVFVLLRVDFRMNGRKQKEIGALFLVYFKVEYRYIALKQAERTVELKMFQTCQVNLT